jgi:hypothetical protein
MILLWLIAHLSCLYSVVANTLVYTLVLCCANAASLSPHLRVHSEEKYVLYYFDVAAITLNAP